MICPKCQTDMEAIIYEGIEVDRCKTCQGIWFDAGERDWLRDYAAAAAIDTGDPSTGRERNEINTYRCPRCNGGMLRRVELKQPQVHYEECTSCRGSYFDAGEFVDLARAKKRRSEQGLN